MGEQGNLGGGLSLLSVMGEGSAVQRTPPGRGDGAFPNGRAGLPRVQGKRGDFLSMLVGGGLSG